jgi:hypothetical protein
MKKSILFSFILLISQICLSQASFRDGFVIVHTGDTLTGLIDYREGTKNSDNINFKESDSTASKVYTPNNISGFGYSDGRFFESKYFARSDEDTYKLFLEVLLKGEVSLYTNEGNFFIQKGDSTVYELTVSRKEIQRDGEKVTIVTKKFLEILSLLMSDSEEAKALMPNIVLEKKPLIRIVERYNSGINSPSVRYESHNPAVKFSAGLSGGLMFSAIRVSSPDNDKNISKMNSAYENSNSFTAGLSLYVSFPKTSEKISFQCEMFYSESEYTNPYTDKVSLTQLTIPVGFRYTFPFKKFSPYLNLGILYTINTENQGNLWLYSKIIGLGYDRTPVPLNDSQYGFWLGCGLSTPVDRKIAAFVDVRSEFPFELTDRSFLARINNTRMCLGLRIQL